MKTKAGTRFASFEEFAHLLDDDEDENKQKEKKFKRSMEGIGSQFKSSKRFKRGGKR